VIACLDHRFGNDDLHLLRKCPSPVGVIKPRLSGRLAFLPITSDLLPASFSVEKHRLNRSMF